jgi:hypothetical protein
MHTSEFQAELNGETLLVALTKIDEKIETQKNKIDKDLVSLAQKESQWRNSDKLDSEGQEDIAKARENLELQKQELEIQRELQHQIAQRKSVMEDLRNTIDYSELVGNLQMQYAAKASLLQIQKEGVSVAEARILAARLRIAEARANLNSNQLLQTGVNNITRQANQSVIDFWEQDIHNAANECVRFLCQLFCVHSSAQQAFNNLGVAFNQIAKQIIYDLIQMIMRMILFKSLGGMIGGSGGTSEGTTSTYTEVAHGGVFSGGGISSFSNSIFAG